MSWPRDLVRLPAGLVKITHVYESFASMTISFVNINVIEPSSVWTLEHMTLDFQR